MTKERPYVDRQKAKELECAINTILGENVGHRKTIIWLGEVIFENKQKVIKLQAELDVVLKGKVQNIPYERPRHFIYTDENQPDRKSLLCNDTVPAKSQYTTIIKKKVTCKNCLRLLDVKSEK